ncbi:protein LKAAEAR1-like [Amphiura filiformis]|uniref:protein LKAAEAR1-like n=1 Tax=Amphiura filiformis TaxID=82378 RepID=UPI003B215F64
MGDQESGKKPHNRKKLSQREVAALHPVQRSKYLAYEDASKSVADSIANSSKRVQDKKKADSEFERQEQFVDVEKEKHSQLIGQLKAAEARNRLRVMRIRYQNNRAQEVKHLISCQPTAIKAVRLQAMVPPVPDRGSPGDGMDKLERKRVETLVEDEHGLTIDRDLS